MASEIEKDYFLQEVAKILMRHHASPWIERVLDTTKRKKM